MNPADAEARGLKNGDIVEAYNDRGHCVCKLKYDMAIRPGMVSSPKGWPRKFYISGSYQELTGDHLNLLDVYKRQEGRRGHLAERAFRRFRGRSGEGRRWAGALTPSGSAGFHTRFCARSPARRVR